jgi:ADP-L-glycero-D-manno-heptose 6-epimerase
VTGANGFIGQNLVKKLKSHNKTVIEVDTHNIAQVLEDFPVVSEIFHLGAISSTTETDFEKITATNQLLSCQLLKKAIELDIPFTYASSASVYGTTRVEYCEGYANPSNLYAISKHSFDLIVENLLKDNPELKIYGARYFNVYGPGEDHKGDQASPVHKFYQQAITTGEINVFKGSKNFNRDFIYVDDAVNMTMLLETFEPGIYNIGTGVARSFLDVAWKVAKFTGASIVEIPFPESLKGHYQEYTCSDNQKFNKEFGDIYPCYSLEDGIEKFLETKKKIGFTNGCFDVLHIGHINLLKELSKKCDRVIVGIDSDEKVKSMKGADRPFNNENDRKEMLESLRFVDEVRIFHSKQGLVDLVSEICPSLMMVGDDYKGKEVVGSEYAKKLKFFKKMPGYSTTTIMLGNRVK